MGTITKTEISNQIIVTKHNCFPVYYTFSARIVKDNIVFNAEKLESGSSMISVKKDSITDCVQEIGFEQTKKEFIDSVYEFLNR